MTTTVTAQQRRAILANAHAKWFATSSPLSANRALAATLTELGYIEATDRITDIHMDSTTICITVDCDEFTENLELDAYGNILQGASE